MFESILWYNLRMISESGFGGRAQEKKQSGEALRLAQRREIYNSISFHVRQPFATAKGELTSFSDGKGGIDAHMGNERLQVKEYRQQLITDLSDCIQYLRTQQVSPHTQCYKFNIAVAEHPIQSEDIRKLLDFDYEFALTERNGQVVVTTGTRHTTGAPPNFLFGRDLSRLYLHTHPRAKAGSMDVTTPSFADIYKSDLVNETTPLVLAHAGGIMLFRAPYWDPIEKRPFNGEAREMMLRYGSYHNIDVFGNEGGKKQSYFDMTHAQQVAFQRKFVEDTRMIIAEASWVDTEGMLQIMDVINLKHPRLKDQQ